MHEMHYTRFDFLIYLIHNFRDSITDALLASQQELYFWGLCPNAASVALVVF